MAVGRPPLCGHHCAHCLSDVADRRPSGDARISVIVCSFPIGPITQTRSRARAHGGPTLRQKARSTERCQNGNGNHARWKPRCLRETSASCTLSRTIATQCMKQCCGVSVQPVVPAVCVPVSRCFFCLATHPLRELSGARSLISRTPTSTPTRTPCFTALRLPVVETAIQC